MAPKITLSAFLWRSLFWSFFGQVWANPGKILRTPKKLPAPPPIHHSTHIKKIGADECDSAFALTFSLLLE